MKQLPSIIIVLFAVILFAGNSFAQDPTKVDSNHYKVIFENDDVRVLRITYGAGEKSVMHYHPDAVAVMLTDGNTNFTLPDGKVIEAPAKQGETAWHPAGKHLPQNVGDKTMEVILVELK
jgi:quercetin dioxygenase-like cupin family protein